MKNKEFDDIIKKKLESLDTNGSEGAWDLFKEKWDNESALDSTGDKQDSTEDHDLDQKIKTDMQKLRIPFNSKHWIILKEQLELEALFKKKLFVAKSVELVILAFLVVGILNLWPIQNDIYYLPINNIPMVESFPVDKETAEKHEAQEEARLVGQRVLSHKIYNSTKKVVERTVQSVEVLANIPWTSALEKGSVKKSIDQSAREKTSEKTINASGIQFPFINVIESASGNEKSEKSSALLINNEPIALLQQKEIQAFEIPKRPTGFPDIILDYKQEKDEENTYMSFAVGPKMNMINSPFDPVYKIDPYNIVKTNFNITAKLHKEIGPIELFAGLGYTNTSYVPRLVNETYEAQESQFNKAWLENIKFKTFNIPLGVRHNIINSKNYQLYTTAAMEVNLIADSEYIIQDIPVNGRSQPAGPPPAPSRNNEVNSNSDLSLKEFNKGIFSGGSLKDNLYITASVGLGLNWNVSSRSGVFVEPRYAHFISSKGIGPNADKVHGVSVDLGFRFQLN